MSVDETLSVVPSLPLGAVRGGLAPSPQLWDASSTDESRCRWASALRLKGQRILWEGATSTEHPSRLARAFLLRDRAGKAEGLRRWQDTGPRSRDWQPSLGTPPGLACALRLSPRLPACSQRGLAPLPSLTCTLDMRFGIRAVQLMNSFPSDPLQAPPGPFIWRSPGWTHDLGGDVVFPKCRVPVLSLLVSCFLFNKITPWRRYFCVKR